MGKFQCPARDTVLELLYAAYNIAGADYGVNPDDAYGRNLTKSAMKTINMLFDSMDGKQKGTTQGVLLAVRLLAETTCADMPETYAQREIKRGFDGDRVEEIDAGLQLPTFKVM